MKMKRTLGRLLCSLATITFSLGSNAADQEIPVPQAVVIDGNSGRSITNSAGNHATLAGTPVRAISPNIGIRIVPMSGPLNHDSLWGAESFQARALMLIDQPTSLVAPAGGTDNQPKTARRIFWHDWRQNLGSSIPLWMGAGQSLGDPNYDERGTVTYWAFEVHAGAGVTFNPIHIRWKVEWVGSGITPVPGGIVSSDAFGPGAHGMLGADMFTTGSMDRRVSHLMHAGFSGYLQAASVADVENIGAYINSVRPTLKVTYWLTDDNGVIIAEQSAELKIRPSTISRPILTNPNATQSFFLRVNSVDGYPLIVEQASNATGPWSIGQIMMSSSGSTIIDPHAWPGVDPAKNFFRVYIP